MKNVCARVLALIGALALLLTGCAPNDAPGLPEAQAMLRDKTYHDRVFALSQVWARAADLYGYWDHIDEDFSWDDAYYRALGELAYVESDYDYYMLLERFMAQLMDGHVSVGQISGAKAVRSLPLELKYIEGQYVLAAKGESVAVPLGSVLLEVEGQPIDSYMEEHVAPLVGLQTPLARQQKMAKRLVTGPDGQTLALTFETPAGERVSVAPAFGKGSSSYVGLPIYDIRGNRFNSNAMEVSVIEGGIAHVLIKTFGDPALVNDYYNEVLPAIEGCRGVVIDLRYCPGGNSNTGFLVMASVGQKEPGNPQSWAQVRNGHDMAMANYLRYPQLLSMAFGPEADVWGEQLRADPAMLRGEQMLKHRYYAPTDPDYAEDDFAAYFAGFYNTGTGDVGELLGCVDLPAVVLLGHEGGSATDTVASLVKSMGTPTVGTHTAGYTGENLATPIYHNWLVTFSAKRTVGADNQAIWNVGIPADIYVEQTLADALAGIDTQLEAAIAHLETLEP